MARLSLTAKAALGSYPTLQPAALAATLTMAAPGVAGDGVAIPWTGAGKNLLLVQNTDVGAQTVTINSTADPQNRTGDITTYALAAGALAVFGPFERAGWVQPDGTIYAVGSHVGVKFAVITLP